jgi:hypothetical protein
VQKKRARKKHRHDSTSESIHTVYDYILAECGNALVLYSPQSNAICSQIVRITFNYIIECSYLCHNNTRSSPCTCFPKHEFTSQNAKCCSLKQSKRATSLIGVTRAGDVAIIDRFWTRVAAREHIVEEIQTI